jgi:hypothetical protein
LQSIAKGEHMNVYVVEVGTYSDRSIVGVTSTTQKAKELIETMKEFYTGTEDWRVDDEFTIHKFELDALPVYVEQIIFEVTYHAYHDNWHADRVTFDYLDDMTLNKVITWNASDLPNRPAYRVLLAVKDEETALKAGTERILQFIAKEKK